MFRFVHQDIKWPIHWIHQKFTLQLLACNVFKMFNNFYKVLAVQFPFLLCSSILVFSQSLAQLTPQTVCWRKDREDNLDTHWAARVLGTETGETRGRLSKRCTQQMERGVGEGESGGGGKGGRRGPQRAESSRLGHSVLIGKLAQFSFCQLIQVSESSSPGEQYICFCQVP